MKYFLTKTIILLSCFGFLPAFSNNFFVPKSMFLDDFPYPFEIQPIDIPDFVFNTIQNSDILFLGEKHFQSVFLEEKRLNKKVKYSNRYRINSLNQENIYFHFIDGFSKIHKEAKKCLWLEYDFYDFNFEEQLKISTTSLSYYLVNTAKEQGWSVFAVDNKELPVFGPLRNQFMAKQIAQTIKDGYCEKGIASNGMAHLSAYKDYLEKHNLEFTFDKEKYANFLDELVKIELENLELAKTIGFFIMEDWSELVKTKEDFIFSFTNGKRDFSGWNLTLVDLKWAKLQGINLSWANLKRTNLEGVDLSWAKLLEADLSWANLYKANLTLVDLRWAKLQETNLELANLTLANLKEADLDGAILIEANLKGAKLKGANLKGANLTLANLSNADLFLAELKNVDLGGANLKQAQLTQANLTSANLTLTNLRKAELQRADLREANLWKADLRQANLTKVKFEGANLKEADLSEAILRGADLRGVYFLNQAKLIGADLREADLRGLDLSGLDLTGVKLKGAKLKGVKGLSLFERLKALL